MMWNKNKKNLKLQPKSPKNRKIRSLPLQIWSRRSTTGTKARKVRVNIMVRIISSLVKLFNQAWIFLLIKTCSQALMKATESKRAKIMSFLIRGRAQNTETLKFLRKRTRKKGSVKLQSSKKYHKSLTKKNQSWKVQWTHWVFSNLRTTQHKNNLWRIKLTVISLMSTTDTQGTWLRSTIRKCWQVFRSIWSKRRCKGPRKDWLIANLQKKKQEVWSIRTLLAPRTD